MKKQLVFLLMIMWITPVLMTAGSISMQERTMDERKRSNQSQNFEWQAASPESQGMSSQKLDKLRDSLARRNTKTFLVIRNDKIVYEWYSPNHSATRKHYTASMAKALVGGVCLAVAVSDGRIALDDKAAKYVPQWKDDPARSKIAIRHLGSHTSGIEDAEADNLPHDKLTGWKGDFWKQLAVPNDPFSISRDMAPMLFDPGTQFQYSNPGIGMLSYAITSALRDAPEKDLRTVLRDRVMRPIGASDAGWSAGYGKTYTVDGLPIVASWGGGAYTARAAARVGRLMLRKGNWEGTQLISEEAVRLTTSSAGLPGEVGMGWWTNADGRYAGLPEDAFWASGAGHQTLLVVPSLNLICVRNGGALSSKKEEYQKAQGLYLFAPLMDAITDTAQPPYPHSPAIKAMVLDWSTHERFAQGSDNWQLTWADDGHQYAPWGDGGGFGGTNSDGRVSLGVARVEGSWDKYRGYNVWGGKNPENPADFGGKSWGIVCVDGVLYMWISPGSPLKVMQAEARLYQSTDHAATWQPADWSFVRADELTIPTICQFGRDYTGARDEFVYHYLVHPQLDEGFEAQIPGIIHLARVPKNRIMERQAYEFFTGFDGDAKPQWSGDLSARKPVFEDPNGVGWNLSVSYNAGLKRYILMTEHTNSSKGDLGVFDAPEPWGPWTTIEYMNRSNDRQFGAGHVVDNTFFWNIPTKWQSEDGTEFSLIFTGAGRGKDNDSWNMIRGKFILFDQ